MMKPLILAAVAVAALAVPALSPAWAADKSADVPPAMKAAFTGTIVSTYPDGRKGKLWLSEDGSYTAAGRKNDRSSGHWEIKGDQVCLAQSHPIPVPFHFCTPLPQSKTWHAKAVSGEPITVHLMQGGRA